MTKTSKVILHLIAGFTLKFIVTLLCRSLRINKKNFEGIETLLRGSEQLIICFWHGSMLVPWYIFRNFNFTALVSKSKDGKLLADLLKFWGYDIVRGSSNDGGKEAMDKMQRKIDENKSLLITPDGPTGPPFKLKPGAIVMAVRNNYRVVFIGVGYEKKRVLKSWDSFIIPKFFSRVNVIFSEPLLFESTEDRNRISEIIKKSEMELYKIHLEAQNFD